MVQRIFTFNLMGRKDEWMNMLFPKANYHDNCVSVSGTVYKSNNGNDASIFQTPVATYLRIIQFRRFDRK